MKIEGTPKEVIEKLKKMKPCKVCGKMTDSKDEFCSLSCYQGYDLALYKGM